MALIDVDWRPPPRQLRQFAALFLVVFAALGTVLWLKERPLIASQVLWGLSLVVGVTGLIFPKLVRPVYVGMMAVALPIGFVVSTLMLIVIYYLVLTPIGLIARLLRYDPMRRSAESAAASYWIRRTPASDPRRYFKQY